MHKIERKREKRYGERERENSANNDTITPNRAVPYPKFPNFPNFPC